MTSALRLAAVLIICSSVSATAQSPPGPSPVSRGTLHSSPETPDKPKSWGDGQPPATNPSTNALDQQPSVGGRDLDGSDPTRPNQQGSQSKRG